MMILPVTLTYAAAAAVINVALAIRILKLRVSGNVVHGDGGNLLLARRMRAQSNFIEYTPFVLILCALVEMASGARPWLWVVMGIYTVARLAHAHNMDADLPGIGRKIGTMATFLTLLTLSGAALYAAWCPVA
jgi:uncharacterized protein